jgi:hypothetical protein
MKPTNCQTALDAFLELTSKEEQKLQGVFERIEDGCRTLIVLRFAAAALVFLADADNDTIEVRCQEADALDHTGQHCVSTVSPWVSVVGRPFGCGWVTINQQGYQDGVLLSFGGLAPSVLLTVVATNLRVYGISEAAK